MHLPPRFKVGSFLDRVLGLHVVPNGNIVVGPSPCRCGMIDRGERIPVGLCRWRRRMMQRDAGTLPQPLAAASVIMSQI